MTNRLGTLLARLIVRGLPGPCQVLARAWAWAWLAAETSDVEEECLQLSSAEASSDETHYAGRAAWLG